MWMDVEALGIGWYIQYDWLVSSQDFQCKTYVYIRLLYVFVISVLVAVLLMKTNSRSLHRKSGRYN